MTQTLTAGDETPPPHRTAQVPPAQQPLQTPPSPQSPPVDQPERESQAPLRANSPASLLAVIPLLLGFRPEASLVLIGTEPPRHTVKVTLRYDLPDPPGAGVAADIAAHALAVIGAQGLTTAVAVGYGPAALVDQVADAVRDEARKARIDLREFLRVEAGRYWSYVCGEEACCPAAGVPFEVSAPAGPQVLPDRAAVAARVAPLGGITAESMRRATGRAERHVTQLLARVRKSARRGAARHLIAAEGLAEVGAMIAAYRAGGRYATDYQVAWVTVTLRDLRVRDDAWARMDPAQVDAHRRLWTDVTRRAQPGYVAAPAALLAFVAWQSGDGALANVALDRALADDPRYSMALLLRQVITAGAPPSLARLPMTPEEVAASYDEAEAEDGRDDGYDHELDLDVHDLDPDDEL
jgi:uncharacterized protein DUF4192